MASFVPIAAAGWKVESAILGPTVPSWMLRPGPRVSGHLVNRCKPIESVSYHCTKGHSGSFGLHRPRPLQRSSSSNWWPGKCKSVTESPSKGRPTVVKAADAGHTNSSASGRRLVLWNQRDLTKDKIDKILAAECINGVWTPQLCYLSMTDYVKNKDDDNQDDLRVVEIESHAFNIKLIQKQLKHINLSPTLCTKTIIIIGSSDKGFETAVSELTDTTPKFSQRQSRHVARLQTKEDEPGKCWQHDRFMTSRAWKLVTPDQADPLPNPKKRTIQQNGSEGPPQQRRK